VVGAPGEPIGNWSDHTDKLKLPPGATFGSQGLGYGRGDQLTGQAEPQQRRQRSDRSSVFWTWLLLGDGGKRLRLRDPVNTSMGRSGRWCPASCANRPNRVKTLFTYVDIIQITVFRSHGRLVGRLVESGGS